LYSISGMRHHDAEWRDPEEILVLEGRNAPIIIKYVDGELTAPFPFGPTKPAKVLASPARQAA